MKTFDDVFEFVSPPGMDRELMEKLVWDNDYAHAWLCHSDGSECSDGCNTTPAPDRAALYDGILVGLRKQK